MKGLSVLLLCIADVGHGEVHTWEEDTLFLNHPLRNLSTCMLCFFLNINEGIAPFLLPKGGLDIALTL